MVSVLLRSAKHALRHVKMNFQMLSEEKMRCEHNEKTTAQREKTHFSLGDAYFLQ
jgi:hypothetical protein